MSIKGTHHFIGYFWQDGILSMRLRTWTKPGAASTDVLSMPLQGKLRFRVENDRRCTGYFDFESGERFACPDAATPEKKHQCEGCMDREGFVPWLRCDGREIPTLLPAVRAYVESPHYLYLASFGDENVKVGMASEKRKAARLDDQGPLAANYVAKGNGISIRQLEVEISRLGYTEFVRRSRKLKLLTEGCARSRAETMLDEALRHIRGQLSEEYARLLLDVPEPYAIPAMARDARGFNELDVLEPPPEKILDVEVIAGSGSIAIVNDGGIKSAIDLGELVGRVIHLNPDGEVQREARQIGLF